MEYVGNDTIQNQQFESISESENITKSVLKEGTGDLTPNNKAKVRVQLVCRLINGDYDEIIENSIKFKQERVFKVWSEGKRQFMVNDLNYGVMSMRKGEIALFKIRGKGSAFGDAPVVMNFKDANKSMKDIAADTTEESSPEESAQILRNDSVWYFYLEMNDFELNLNQIPRSYDECVYMAQQLKELGNQAFNKKKYKRAIESYQQMEQTLNHHDNFGKGPDKTRWVDNLVEKKKTIFELRKTMQLNHAMALLKEDPGRISNAKRAIYFCNRVLNKDKSNKKALFRKARALRYLGDLDRAEEFLETVIGLQGEDKSLEQEKKRLKTAQEKAQNKTDAVFQQVWGGIQSGKEKGLYDDVEPYDEDKDWNDWINKQKEQGKKVWFGCDGSAITEPASH
eukprot:gb/GECH01005357.1/.p1 GENE.gb/GECH01005357.1/~~gb/GECH01005357.1/.p1  ORF type:complete len:396 (+),score=106.73 gb/GECH01005357.1/:1-1188(+)